MAEVVMMRHPQTGEIKKGFMGFSWTVFFWAWIPMLCRKDWMMGLPYLLLQTLYLFVTIGHYDSEYSLVSFLAQLGFAFSYNKTYTKGLIEKGFRFSDSDVRNQAAAASVGMSLDACTLPPQGAAAPARSIPAMAPAAMSEPERGPAAAEGEAVVEAPLQTGDEQHVPQSSAQEQAAPASQPATHTAQTGQAVSAASGKNWQGIFVIASLLAALLIVGIIKKDVIREAFAPDSGGTTSGRYMSPEERKIDALEKFSGQSDISPWGELNDMFSYGSRYTDIQRENMLAKLKGRIVSWDCTVYEVSKSSDRHYRIIPESTDGHVGLILDVVARNDEEAAYIESLMTGTHIVFTGMFDGNSFMRSLVLDPVILAHPSRSQAHTMESQPQVAQSLPQAAEKQAADTRSRILSRVTISAIYVGRDEEDPEFCVYVFRDAQGVDYRLYGMEETRSELENYRGRMLRVEYVTQTFYFEGGEGMMKGDFLERFEPV